MIPTSTTWRGRALFDQKPHSIQDRGATSDEELQYVRTSDCYRLTSVLSTGQEDDVLLRDIDIIVLQEKDLVNAIVLKCRELEKQANWTCQ